MASSKSLKANLLHFLEPIFGIDVRSLALFRIGLGSVLLADLLLRARDFTAHYTDGGVLPLHLLTDDFLHPAYLSLHLMNPSTAFQATLFIFGILCAISLILGYQTRAVTILCWIFITSLRLRNPFVRYGGDQLLTMLFFWSLFLPLGARASLDALRVKHIKPHYPERVFSLASICLLLQPVLVYWMSAITKTGEAWKNGQALYYAMHADFFTTDAALSLLQYPQLMKALTHFALFYEYLAPALLLTPILIGPIRTFAISGLLLVQLGFGAFLALGLFPWISTIAVLPFVPSWLWDKARTLSATSYRSEKTIMLRTLHGVMGVFFICIVISSFTSMGFKRPAKDYFIWVAKSLQVGQSWFMFAPAPRDYAGWYVIPGKLRNGKTLDILSEAGEVSWKRPSSSHRIFRNQRWRNYLFGLASRAGEIRRPYYSEYLCRRWNQNHQGGETLEEFDIYVMFQRTPAPGDPPVKVKKRHLLQHSCSATI